MSDVIKDLYEVILSRRDSEDSDSYTAYLFREGLDKILKKVGEESSETIIAAKSLEAAPAEGDAAKERRDDLTNEVSDLVYHILVMLAERGVRWEEIEAVLEERANKQGNLKQKRTSNINN
jgi:phosphoribosyl-ATP pyrophosphohydrolase